MNYQCSVCSQKIPGDLIAYVDHTEKHVIDLVKHDHPDWVEKNGMCQKCLDYYRAEINGSVFKDAPCALRIRKTKKVFSFFKNLFNSQKTE